MGNEQKMGTNRPTLNRLNKFTILDAKILNQIQKIKKKKKKKKKHWVRTSSPWV